MPSKKGSLAWEARQTRIKANRRIKALDKALKDTTITRNQKITLQKAKERIEQVSKDTYTGRGKLSKQDEKRIRQANAQLESLSATAKIVQGKNGISNFETQTQINLASRKYSGEDSYMERAANPSRFTREEVKVFYNVTQRIWQADAGEVTDTSQINKRIMAYFKTDSLEEAMRRALSAPSAQLALKIARGEIDRRELNLTPEQRALYEQFLANDTDNDKQGSPEYTAYIIQFDPQKDWDEQE